jgi:membrane protein
MRVRLNDVFTISKNALGAWWLKDPFRESAIIAYYSIFSLPGLLLIIITFAGYFFGQDAANSRVIDQFAQMIGTETAEQIQNIIIKATEKGSTVWTTLFGLAIILFAATGVFAQFQKSLNNIWGVKTDVNKSGILIFLKVRLFSIGVIVSIGFILIVSLVISAFLSAFGNWLSNHFSDSFVVLLQGVNFLVSLVIMCILFALMFKYLPDAKIKWKYVWIGSAVTALLFEIGKFGLGYYFGKANPGTGYGAAGSIILILLWASYSSMIVFYGAEFTRAYASLYTNKVVPSNFAAKVSDKPNEQSSI